MVQELIVKPKTKISDDGGKDILSYYGVPSVLDIIVKKEKSRLLNKLSCGIAGCDFLSKLAHSKDFYVEIPGGLREMLKSGNATFDKSIKNPGSFTPNIRIKGENGIKGQATIVEKADPQAVTQSISNLAMMAMVQIVLEKLDVLEKKVEDGLNGQKDDRIGSIIGSFKAFMDLYPNFKSTEELNYAVIGTYNDMQKGLAQLHLQIERERGKLSGAPTSDLETVILAIKNLFHNETERYQKYYESYVYDIQLYNRLILLSDILLHLKGANDAIAKNHKVMVEYCNTNLDASFQKNMKYLMAGNTTGIDKILKFNVNLTSAFAGELVKNLIIECKQEDVKYLTPE